MTETPRTHDETLAQRMRRGPIEPRVALGILEQLLTALEPFHRRGAVHGHVTPQVISLLPDGDAVLGGLKQRAPSKKKGAAAAVTPQGADEVAYLSPEQIRGEHVDARADVFALGVVGHQMLVGKHPFGAGPGVPASTLEYRIVCWLIPEIAPNSVPGLPEGVPAIGERAMANDLERRYADAGSFREALREAMSTAVAASPVAPSQTAAATPITLANPVIGSAPPWEEQHSFVDTLVEWTFEIRRNWAPYFLAGALLIVALAVVILVVVSRG